jgi:3-oxoacyl-[acyl-carrier protein] reductase
MNNSYNLSGKKVFITGGTGGIGSTTVKNLLIRENAEVFFTSSSQEKIDKLRSELPQDKKAHGVVCDMNFSDQIDNAVKTAIEKMGQIDVLICNAGTNVDRLFMRMTLDDWQKVINVNLTGNFSLASAVAKEMFKKKYGKIIFITSIVASMGNPGQANYIASKAGLEGFMRCLALEMAKYNINVNAIAPGFIKTEMTDKIPDQIKETLLKKIPSGLMGQTDDVYEMIGFLSSDGAKYITGQTLHVNGGMYLN